MDGISGKSISGKLGKRTSGSRRVGMVGKLRTASSENGVPS